MALHYITLQHITLHYITVITLHDITVPHMTLHDRTLHYITLHYITLHYITLYYITLHTNKEAWLWVQTRFVTISPQTSLFQTSVASLLHEHVSRAAGKVLHACDRLVAGRAGACRCLGCSLAAKRPRRANVFHLQVSVYIYMHTQICIYIYVQILKKYMYIHT